MKLMLLATTAVLAVAGPATATIYNTLGGIENGGDPLAVAGPTIGDFFVAGAADTVRSITFNLSLTAPSTKSFLIAITQVDPNFKVGDLNLTAIGNPDFALGHDSTLTTSFSLRTYGLMTPFALVQGATYFIGLFDPGQGSAVVLGNTLDAGVLARPEVVAGAYYYNNGGVQANAGGPYELSINTFAVPEPATLALLGMGGIALLARARRTRD